MPAGAGYEGISSGVHESISRGYKCWVTRVLMPVYAGISTGVQVSGY